MSIFATTEDLVEYQTNEIERLKSDIIKQQRFICEQQETIEQDNRLINAQQQKVVELQTEIESLKAKLKAMGDENREKYRAVLNDINTRKYPRGL